MQCSAPSYDIQCIGLRHEAESGSHQISHVISLRSAARTLMESMLSAAYVGLSVSLVEHFAKQQPCCQRSRRSGALVGDDAHSLSGTKPKSDFHAGYGLRCCASFHTVRLMWKPLTSWYSPVRSFLPIHCTYRLRRYQ